MEAEGRLPLRLSSAASFSLRKQALLAQAQVLVQGWAHALGLCAFEMGVGGESTGREQELVPQRFPRRALGRWLLLQTHE